MYKAFVVAILVVILLVVIQGKLPENVNCPLKEGTSVWGRLAFWATSPLQKWDVKSYVAFKLATWENDKGKVVLLGLPFQGDQDWIVLENTFQS